MIADSAFIADSSAARRRGIDCPEIRRIADQQPVRRMPKGYTVVQEGEPCDGFWIVMSGSVNVQRIAMDGRVQILETCFPGEAFGLEAAIDGREHPAGAVTREVCTLIFFPRRELIGAMRASPLVSFAIATAFAERMRGMEGRFAAAALHSVRGRVAAHIAEEALARGVRAEDGAISVRLREAQEEIARKIGTVREVVARAFRALREDGVIEQRRDLVRVRDLARLRLVAAS